MIQGNGEIKWLLSSCPPPLLYDTYHGLTCLHAWPAELLGKSCTVILCLLEHHLPLGAITLVMGITTGLF